MNNIVGLAIFAAGIVLLIFGYDSQTHNSGLPHILHFIPVHRSGGMLAGGGLAVVVGLIMAIRSRKR
jgi:multisubunit Na+/H+ antiporter MnhB subunit